MLSFLSGRKISLHIFSIYDQAEKMCTIVLKILSVYNVSGVLNIFGFDVVHNMIMGIIFEVSEISASAYVHRVV